MATRAVQQVVTYLAWDTSANTYKTGDSANHTTSWVKDGTRSATSNATAEVDSTNCPGLYKVTMTSTETDCLEGWLGGKSSTANVVLIPTGVAFDYIPNAAAGASGGMLINGSNSGTVTLAALTVTGSLTISDGLLISRSSSNTSAITATGNGTGSGAVFTSGSGATGNGVSMTAASTNGTGLSLAGTGTGSGLLSNTVTVSGATTLTGAVSLGSTLTVSGLTTLTGLTTGAISASTITASGAVAFQSTLAVTGTTTLTGAVSLGSTLGVTGLTTLGGLTTGAISASTITASGAVAFQSTFAVTTSTALGAVSGSTLTLSGAVAFQSTFVVTGATTLTGAVAATNAGNDIRLGSTQNTAIATAVWGTVMDGTNTALQVMRGFIAALLGKVSGMSTGAPAFRNIADTKDVIVATTDADGNRTAVTLDLT